jgi:hypothetical protein
MTDFILTLELQDRIGEGLYRTRGGMGRQKYCQLEGVFLRFRVERRSGSFEGPASGIGG